MTERQAIAAEFTRRETEAGGYAETDARALAEAVAREWGIPVEDVLAVVRDMQMPWGAG